MPRDETLRIKRVTLATCSTVTGLVVVIDVLRAFTTAAFLFQQGVKEILLVSGVEESFALREKMSDCILIGEVDGVKVPGFDFGNSPSQIEGHDLHNKQVIQRTTAGTQGVVFATQANIILATGLVTISATVRYIKKLNPSQITLIQTGFFVGQDWGDDDVACADAIECLLLNQTVSWKTITQRVRASRSGTYYDGSGPHFPSQDLEMALEIDRFNFAMRVKRKQGLNILHCIEI